MFGFVPYMVARLIKIRSVIAPPFLISQPVGANKDLILIMLYDSLYYFLKRI